METLQPMKRFGITLLFCTLLTANSYSQNKVIESNTTTISISIPSQAIAINPMIYGQMLEDCNDKVIYGGVVSNEGKENMAVTELLRPLAIPVMRWPAGTAIYDYEWKKGIGPERKAEKEYIWGGMEYYTFGTDEFIGWCNRLEIEPYINLPMGNNNTYQHSLGNALDWIEYVNGASTTTYGALRAKYGHPEPYNVKFWCIGNENYLGNRFHKSESAQTYATNLAHWGKVIKSIYPDVSLLGVGRTSDWTKVILDHCHEWIDYITLHYYYTAQIDNKELLNPEKTLFTGALVEANIKDNIAVLKQANEKYGRESNPIHFSVDEWNNRHSVKKGEKFYFTRQDDRRQYDVVTVATMLNVFLRNSPHIAMGNYIFPVNGHGLVKSVGEDGAYRGATYYVFELYRKYLLGNLVNAEIIGPGYANARIGDFARLDGDVAAKTKDIRQDLCYVDAAAVVNQDGLCIAVVNRSHDKEQKVKLNLPDGYKISEIWSIESEDITAANTIDNTDVVKPQLLKTKKHSLTLSPCGLQIVRCTTVKK